MKNLIAILIVLNSSAAFAAYPTSNPTLGQSSTQQRLQNEMSTQQQLHQQQLHLEQQNSAQQLQQSSQQHQQQMLRRVERSQP